MQRLSKAFRFSRSRKALVDFNCISNKKKLSLPIFVGFWVLPVVLFNLQVGFCLHAHCDGIKNPVGQLGLCQADTGLIERLFHGTECSSAEISDQSLCTSSMELRVSESEVQPKQDYQTCNAKTDGEQVVVENFSPGKESQKDTRKSDRLLHDVPLGLDEFKNKAINPKGKNAVNQSGIVLHRVEPDGKEYDYATASKGAKVLAFNKEAKGASNILGKDMDKYLRNPCSAEEKFVIIELSEETLVVTIELANFEHYSSNFKDFQLLGSLVYPTETWVELGHFTARNVKQSQRFTLHEPKWVRYLKLNFLSYYGSEFYCTLSIVKVYGVDAVEHMLEDLISNQVDMFASENSTDGQKIDSSRVAHSQTDDLYENPVTEGDLESIADDSVPKTENSKTDVSEQVGDLRPQPLGRMPADSVLKILMQKVRSLDVNLSVLERYLEELNSRYANIFKDLEKEISEKHILLENIRSNVASLVNRNEAIVKDVSDIISWKSLVSLQIDNLKTDNALLRLEVEKVLQNQTHMENKGVVVFLIVTICSFLATVKLVVNMAISVCCRKPEFRSFCATNFSWICVLFSCSMIGVILLL